MFAQLAIRAWSFGELMIALVVIMAVVALVFVAIRQFQIPIPGWVVQVLGIVFVAFVIIVAIRLVLGM